MKTSNERNSLYEMPNSASEKHLDKNPLVTCILITYNQSCFVNSAIDGLLEQDYNNIEIIISDDASTDDTQATIIKHLESYGGPSNIRLNLNKINMGISKHVRYLHKMAKGNIIVHAAGDDISKPNRVTKIVNAFISQNHPSMVISNATKIDRTGNLIGPLVEKTPKIMFEKAQNIMQTILPFNGCTAAISRKLIDVFDDPIDGLFAEDVVLTRRAHLLNGILYLPECLVEYRVHSGSISNFNKDSYLEKINYDRKITTEILLALDQFIIDARMIGYSISEDEKIIFHSQKILNKLALKIIEKSIIFVIQPLVLGLIISGRNIRYKKRLLSIVFAKIMLTCNKNIHVR